MHTINTEILIIGGGPAGMFAGFTCGLLGMKTVIVEHLSKLGGQCRQIYPEKFIHDIPGFMKIKAGHFINNLEAQLKQFSCVSCLFSEKVVDIKKVEDHFETDISSGRIVSQKIIFGSGAGEMVPNKPNLSNLNSLEAKGKVRYFMDDLSIFKDKVVAILGGGDSAGDWCLSLASLARQISLVHRRSVLRLTKSVENQIRSMGNAEILLDMNVESIEECNEKLVLNLGTNELEVDYVVPCYGMNPEPSFNNEIGLNLDNSDRIIVDPATCESNIPGIYAIGEACSYKYKRCLISIGTAEAVKAVYNAHSKLHPQVNVKYSTTILGEE